LILEAKGSFMGKYVGRDEEGPSIESKKNCKSLLEAKQPVPVQGEFFEEICEMLHDRNEAGIIRDIFW
jgi:hypothetical protein